MLESLLKTTHPAFIILFLIILIRTFRQKNKIKKLNSEITSLNEKLQNLNPQNLSSNPIITNTEQQTINFKDKKQDVIIRMI